MTRTSRPGLREPLVWLVFGIPAIAVVALVVDGVHRRRPGQHRQRGYHGETHRADPGRRPRARRSRARLQLAALLRIDGKELEILALHAGFDTAAPLKLALRHPTRADLDHELLMQPTPTGWRAPTGTRHRA
jgi:hypothetical protein